MKTAIITAADAGYFPLLVDLLDSLDRAQPSAADKLDVCILDLGLTPEQRDAIRPRTAQLLAPGWLFDFPARSTVPRHYQAFYARPFFPDLFPQYDRYLHLDADCWLQDTRALELLLLPTEHPVLAIVPEIHRAYAHNYRRKPATTDWLRNTYTACYDETVAQWLVAMPIINAGVWAMRRDVPFWKVWADTLQSALQKYAGPLTEQCALNYALHTGKIDYYPLPAWCNWMCAQSIPLFDPDSRRFYEPLLPHEPISILHLNDLKSRPVPVPHPDGTTHEIPLTFSATHPTRHP